MMLPKRFYLRYLLTTALVVLSIESVAAKDSTITIDDEGTIHTPNGILPISRILSPEAQDAMQRYMLKGRKQGGAGVMASYAECGIENLAKDFLDPVKLLAARKCGLKRANLPGTIKQLESIHPVEVETTKINNIEVDIVVPKTGIAKRNNDRVLFYIHGSGGYLDHPDMRKLGSIPAAAVGNIKVLGVDHRLAPEGRFTDSLEDLALVYRGILNEYPARNIGIFGCSAGGTFTASMIPYLLKLGLPLPGAIAIQGENASSFDGGDSLYTLMAYSGRPVYERFPTGQDVLDSSYLKQGSSIHDPVMEPARHNEIMKQFPPTIWMSSLRDEPLSRIVGDHRAFLRNGVDTELHLWEGLPHCFPSKFPEIPETRDWWQQMNTFFDKHLGTAPLVKQ